MFSPALRHYGVGGESQRCWLLVWERRGGPVQRRQWHPHDLPSTSAGHGGLQVALQRDCAHCVVSAQLLLQVGSYNNVNKSMEYSQLQTLLRREIISGSILISNNHLWKCSILCLRRGLIRHGCQYYYSYRFFITKELLEIFFLNIGTIYTLNTTKYYF